MFIEKYKQALAVLAKKPVMLWGLSILSAIMTGVLFVATMPVLLLGYAATTLISCGMIQVYMDGLKGKTVIAKQLFAHFNKDGLRIVGGMAWQTLWTLIWALVPIAGIVKSYSYAFVPYILITKPDVHPMDALKLSMKMTKGKKFQMFLADICVPVIIAVIGFVLGLLSSIPFIGWLFSLVSVLFTIAAALFSGVFSGLYKAAFYDEKEMIKEKPSRLSNMLDALEERFNKKPHPFLKCIAALIPLILIIGWIFALIAMDPFFQAVKTTVLSLLLEFFN